MGIILVAFLGVFYHLRHPLLGLDLAARVTRDRLVFPRLTSDQERPAGAAACSSPTGRNSPGPVNLGNPVEFRISELAGLVQELVPDCPGISHRSLPIDDPRQRQPDIARARRQLGWEPRVQLREGLERTLVYFRQQLGAELEVGGG